MRAYTHFTHTHMLTHKYTRVQELLGSLVSAGPTLGSQLAYDSSWQASAWHQQLRTQQRQSHVGGGWGARLGLRRRAKLCSHRPVHALAQLVLEEQQEQQQQQQQKRRQLQGQEGQEPLALPLPPATSQEQPLPLLPLAEHPNTLPTPAPPPLLVEVEAPQPVQGPPAPAAACALHGGSGRTSATGRGWHRCWPAAAHTGLGLLRGLSRPLLPAAGFAVAAGVCAFAPGWPALLLVRAILLVHAILLVCMVLLVLTCNPADMLTWLTCDPAGADVHSC